MEMEKRKEAKKWRNKDIYKVKEVKKKWKKERKDRKRESRKTNADFEGRHNSVKEWK